MENVAYIPIMDDNKEHLLQSKSNPDRVRGLARDSDNKHQRIVEWKKVVIDDDSSMIDTVNSILQFINDHPELIDATVYIGYSLRQFVIRHVKTKSKSGSIKKLSPTVKISQNQQSKKMHPSYAPKSPCEDSYKPLDRYVNNSESISYEDAHALVFMIVSDYLRMKETNTLPHFAMDQTVCDLEYLVRLYPSISDKMLYISIIKMLKTRTNEIETEIILSSLKIDYAHINRDTINQNLHNEQLCRSPENYSTAII